MDDDAALLTYAEIAVAFAGFAALVTAFRRGGTAGVERPLAARLRGMIEVALLAGLFSIVALSIRAFGVADETAWRVSSGLLAVAYFVSHLVWFSRGRRMNRAGIEYGGRPIRSFYYALGAASIASLVANALGAFPSATGPVFLSNLGALLFLAGVLFIRLVAGIIPEDAVADGAAQQRDETGVE